MFFGVLPRVRIVKLRPRWPNVVELHLCDLFLHCVERDLSIFHVPLLESGAGCSAFRRVGVADVAGLRCSMVVVSLSGMV